MRFEITIQNGDKQTFITKKTEITLGRSSSNDICIKNENLGRRHLCIVVTEGRFYVTDLGSANGSTINGQKLTPESQVEWHNFFPIILGNCVTVTYLPDKEEVAYLPKKNIPKSKKVIKYEKPNHTPTYFLAALATVLIAYVYFSNRSKPQVDVEVHASAVEQVESLDLLNKFLNQKKCKSEIELEFCQSTEYKLAEEDGIILHNSDLYYFLDFSKHMKKSSFTEEYLQVTSNDRQQYLMLKEAYRTFLKKIVAKNNVDNLYVIDHTTAYPAKIKSVLKITAKDLNKLSVQDVEVVLGQLQKRDKAIYQAVMAPLVKWSKF